MSNFFRAHQAVGMTIPTYFIESTAPDNVDDTVVVPPILPPELKPIDPDQAVRQIAAELVNGPEPNLVVMVHGFNNPEPDVLQMYTAAARAIEADAAVRNRKGLVCVGYRWPSEKIGEPIDGTWNALPTLPTWILYSGVALMVLPFLLFGRGFLNHIVSIAGLVLAGLVLAAALLRTIVYFRDTYRATNYGAPDLVQIIRAIQGEIIQQRGHDRATNDIQLSFIGHSMGGFVVTNTIRVLSDVFHREIHTLNDFGGHSSAPPPPHIGKVFRLKRFVLASPDIPAETLLSNRGNFLASALARFDEAYLFSNEGDEVLRQISTLANYFVFPTKSRNYGFRLGNVEILSSNFGLIDVSEANFLDTLRIGNLTLQQIYDTLEAAKTSRHANAEPARAQVLLPKRFTYFDCTDYVDLSNDGGPARPLLTFAKCVKRTDPNARLRWYSHLHLLFAYIVYRKPNVHGGYFEGLLSQQMIYRLACLGYEGAVAAYGSDAALSQACETKQIRGLLSPLLAARRRAQSLPPGPV
jgi:pimeloyl-ACP methyl ester carboxylesterase